MKPERVLITGATGILGRYLAPAMADRYHILSGVRRPAEGVPNPVPCNIRDYDEVRRATEGVDAVIHLAAQSWEEDVRELMIPDNILGCYNVYEAAREAGVKRFIFASTNHVVGHYLYEETCVDEAVEIRPDTYYAVTKVYGEALGRHFSEKHGLSVLCARIGCSRPDDVILEIYRDEPESRRYLRGVWLSLRDLDQFMDRALCADDISFEVLNCISNNRESLLDLTRARDRLGYRPQEGWEILFGDEDLPE